MSGTTGQIEIRATALEPLHHGAGTSGNTQLMRMQSIVTPDGRQTRVPFISGNSIKHKLRVCAVQYALDVLGVENHSFSKAEVDLLFSGGHLSKAGNAVNLEKARRMSELFPALSLCGYSAGNAMTESKIRVSHLHLVCDENSWRLPDDLAEHPHRQLRAGATRIEEFGTRHEQSGTIEAQRLLTTEASEEKAKKKKESLGEKHADKGDSSQMIYDFQAVAAGSTFWGSIWFRKLTEMEIAALASAFHYASAGKRGDETLMHVGAKSAVGFGQISVDMRSHIRAEAAQYEPSEALVGTENADRASMYNSHLREHRDEILSAIKEAVA